MNLDILVILDRSGSMQDAKTDHEGGLRSFVEDQRGLEGDVRFSLVQFDSQNPCEVVYDRTPIADVKDIVLIPRGGTPLLDAIGSAVSHLRVKLADDASVVVMVITDGEENASREWDKDRVKSLVSELEAKGWSFLFLGANVDAFTEAAALGVGAAASMGYANQHGTGTVSAMYSATSSNLKRARSTAGIRGMSMMDNDVRSSLSYTSEQRNAAMGGSGGTVPSSGDSSTDEKTEG